MELDAGRRPAALAHAQELVALADDDPESQALLNSMR